MSIFGALNTAISGLTSQSASFGNISDSVANSQTVGFKRVDTAFADYLTSSTATNNAPGTVLATPAYRNDVQGTITQTDNTLGMAISGQGFFPVSEQDGLQNGQVQFSPQQYYTRAGDFSMDKNGYLVNSAGKFLNGWSVNPNTGVASQTTLSPIQVTQTVYNPVPTSTVTLSANLPATPAAGVPVSAQVQVYDSLGNQHTVTLDWTQTAVNQWSVAVHVPDDTASPARGTANVDFGAPASGNPVPDGTVGSITAGTGSVTTGTYAAGTAATLGFTADFGNGPQAITLNMGTYGQSTGLTQYTGTEFALRGISQDGVPPGAFASVSTATSGAITVNYDNGQSRIIAQVPVTTFANPDGLQRQNGQAFTASTESGAALSQNAGTNGAGGIVTSSVESSNVDIATEFTNLIVAQRAYSANAKIVTTADDMLQTTLDMKR